VKCFRLIEKVHEKTPLGYGKAGGRWNLKGTPIIYASNYTAINFMELLCIKGPVVAAAKWILVELEIRGDIPHLESKDLPSDWSARPYPKSTQEFGTQWAQSMVTPYLKVPSCRIPLSSYPQEHNLLINPLHPDRNKLIDIISIEEVSFELNKWT